MNAWFHELNIWRERVTVIITLSMSTIHFHIYLRVHSIIFLFDPLGMHYSHENLTAHSPHMLNHEKKEREDNWKVHGFPFLMRSHDCHCVYIIYMYIQHTKFLLHTDIKRSQREIHTLHPEHCSFSGS